MSSCRTWSTPTSSASPRCESNPSTSVLHQYHCPFALFLSNLRLLQAQALCRLSTDRHTRCTRPSVCRFRVRTQLVELDMRRSASLVIALGRGTNLLVLFRGYPGIWTLCLGPCARHAQDRVIRYGVGWDPRTVNGSDNVYWWTSVNGEVRSLAPLHPVTKEAAAIGIGKGTASGLSSVGELGFRCRAHLRCFTCGYSIGPWA